MKTETFYRVENSVYLYGLCTTEKKDYETIEEAIQAFKNEMSTESGLGVYLYEMIRRVDNETTTETMYELLAEK